MRPQVKSLIFNIFLLGFLLIFVVVAFGLPPHSRQIPLVVGLLSLVLLLTSLASENFPGPMRPLNAYLEKLSGGKKSVSSDTEPDVPHEWRRVLVIIIWMIAFAVAILLFGLIITAPLYVFLFLRVYAGEKWTVSLILSLVLLGLMYGTIESLMGLQLFRGIFFGATLPPL